MTNGVKIINIFGNYDDIVKKLREDGYNVVVYPERHKMKITMKAKEGNTVV